MWRVCLMVIFIGSMLGACGTANRGEVAETTTTLAETTTTVDRCAETIEEAVDAMGGVLDRLDSNFEKAVAMDEFIILLNQLLNDAPVGCGPSMAGNPLSEFIVYLSEQSAVRSGGTRAFIEEVVEGVCDFAIDLTTAAQVVCT